MNFQEKVDQKYQRQFAKIEKARIEADYTHLRTFTKEEVAIILSEARDFVAMAKQLLHPHPVATADPSEK